MVSVTESRPAYRLKPRGSARIDDTSSRTAGGAAAGEGACRPHPAVARISDDRTSRQGAGRFGCLANFLSPRPMDWPVRHPDQVAIFAYPPCNSCNTAGFEDWANRLAGEPVPPAGGPAAS